jgi:hypothetical protein
MFSYSFYNVVHIVGIILLMAALGGATLGASAPAPAPAGTRANRRLLGLFHGLGLFLILLGGFGMLARLGIVQGSSWPGWVWVKTGVWVLLGISVALPFRFSGTARPLLFLLPVLGGLAAYMAIYKPL